MSHEECTPFPEVYTRRELNAQYRAIPLKATTSRLLRKYFGAMANLYGIISIPKAKEIIFSLSPKLVTEDEFAAFVEIARHECEHYYILRLDEIYTKVPPTESRELEIIHVDLLEDSNPSVDLFAKTRQCQQGKPYYMPDKEHLLAYEDPFYCENTPEKAALLRFMEKQLGLSDEKLENALVSLLRDIRSVTGSLEKAMSNFEQAGISFRSEWELNRFVELYSNFSNNTRMPCNRGFTPDEIMRTIPPEERFKSLSLGPNIRKSLQNGEIDLEDFRKQVLTMDMPSEALRADLLKQLADIKSSAPQKEEPKKVGRNDPCPCGSGKKYKQCCGK